MHDKLITEHVHMNITKCDLNNLFAEHLISIELIVNVYIN